MSVAAAAAAPVVGFDVIADHIYAIHAQAVASDGIANTVAGVFRVVGRKLVSSFTEGMGKRKSSTGTAGANPPPAKRRVSVVSTSVTNYVGPPTAMLINQDVTPPHAHHRPSVLQPIYKRLAPDQIVRLKAGDEVIVVVPGGGRG